MKQIQRKNPFWSLAGPLLAYFGIQLAVQTVVQAVIQAPYLAQAYIDNFVNGGASDFQEAMNGYLSAAGPAIEQVLKYQVEIAGAAALCTIPLTAVLFAKDRKLEKACGIVPAEKDAARQILGGRAVRRGPERGSDVSFLDGAGGHVR